MGCKQTRADHVHHDRTHYAVTVACIPPGCSCREGRRSGGVAVAQPPATSFYPFRILVPYQNPKQQILARISNGELMQADLFPIFSSHETLKHNHQCIPMFTALKMHGPCPFSLMFAFPCIQCVPWFQHWFYSGSWFRVLGKSGVHQRDTAFVWVGSCKLSFDFLL